MAKKLKILAIHNVGFDKSDKESGVHIWRIWRPLEELKKHVDWQIDYQKTFIKDIEKYKDLSEFTEAEVEAAGKHLGSYDIVFASYHADAAAHSLMGAVSKIYGTKFILDDDDNTFAIEEENPFWTTMSHDHAFIMQRVNRTSKYICTTTQNLADVFKARNEEDAKIYVIPNYIPDTYQSPKPDNGKDIVIGYFGGSGHWVDFEETGIVPALRRLMHDNKKVHFVSYGVPVTEYLPRGRYELKDVVYGRKFVTDLFPTMQFDIGVAPLRQTIFAEGKSNIKWQELTRMGAAFVGSNVGPYKSLKPGTGLLVENKEDAWYDALKSLVDDAEKRKTQVSKAQKELQNWRLEDHWQEYKKMFEEVANDN
jgi:glycosyltransferase involved in cell wall biosynthesis